MIEIKKVLLIALVYYVSFLIAQYNKFKGISVEYREDTLFWRILVWVAWFMYPIWLPVFVVLYLFIEFCRKVTRVYEDSRRYKYNLNSAKVQRKYRHGQGK